MKLEKYNVWKPMSEMPQNLYFVSLTDESNTKLTILLKEFGGGESSRTLKIVFEHAALYRVSQEGHRLKTIAEIPSFENFAVTDNSEFLRWFQEESFGMFENYNLSHYLICNNDNVIDIICSSEGIVTWD